MKEILKVEELRVTYTSFELDKIDLKLNEGEIVGLVGENGAGKSTTIKAIMGMIKRNSGEIYYLGRVVEPKMHHKFRQKIGYVGDSELYYAKIKIKHILKFLSQIYDDWNKEKEKFYLNKFELDIEKKIIELSMGMRVKFEILIALSHDAQIYLLDEPTSGLDPVIRNEVLNILKALKNDGKAILFSSHITTDLEKIADRIIFMDKGKILVNKNIDSIKNIEGTLEDILFNHRKVDNVHE